MGRRKREQKEKEKDGNDENLRDFQMSNMNTSYFGEIEVNLCVASFLEDLTDITDEKKSIANFLRGDKEEIKVEELFSDNIQYWRDHIPFLSNLVRRTDQCMKTISELLDSNTWKKNIYFNPIEYMNKLKKKREKLFFG